MQQLRFLQSAVRHPHLHINDIAVLFGAAEWETRPCFDLQGRVLAGNDWYVQFSNDMRSLASMSAVDAVLDTVLQQPSLLFTDHWVREAFLSVDVQCLRSASHTVSIPPLGFLDIQPADSC